MRNDTAGVREALRLLNGSRIVGIAALLPRASIVTSTWLKKWHGGNAWRDKNA